MDQNKPTEHHLGELLRQMREKAGISQNELAAMTKISSRYVTALEEGRFDTIPGRFFIRGFIRNICAQLEEDPADLLEILDVLFPEEEEPEEAEGTGAGPRRVFLPLAATIIILLILIGGSILLRGKGERAPEPPPVKEAESTPATGELSEVEKVEQDLGEVPAVVDLNLVIRAIDKTWLRIQTDDSDSWETTMRSGDEVRLRAADSINLVIGNAGGVIFELNGKRFGPPGTHGQVISNYVLTRDNL